MAASFVGDADMLRALARSVRRGNKYIHRNESGVQLQAYPTASRTSTGRRERRYRLCCDGVDGERKVLRAIADMTDESTGSGEPALHVVPDAAEEPEGAATGG